MPLTPIHEPNDFRRLILRLRTARGLTIGGLAAKARRSQTCVSHLENQHRQLRLATALAIARALGAVLCVDDAPAPTNKGDAAPYNQGLGARCCRE